jgi:Raf kinase inhibitor-like YbhB/YbcL family protein
MKLTSTSFFNNLNIPLKYASRGINTGQNISPQFAWSDYPNGTKSFILIMVDRHPKAANYVHWLLADIPLSVNKIPEGASNSSKMPAGIQELMNSAGRRGYDGPEPPKGSGRHTYEAIVYALDVDSAGLKGQIDEKKLLNSIKQNILAQASITGYLENL